ncbi:MAG: inositol monophosphatase family protein [Phycisphaerales bacterium]
MGQDPVKDRLAVALSAAEEAGAYSLKLYQNPSLEVEIKPDNSPVTKADKEGEKIIRAAISSSFPTDAVLGEEHGDTPGSSGYRFVIDPIDGTRSFASGIPTYAVLIGVQDTRTCKIVAGVAHFPALRETLWASAKGGAWWKTATGQTRRAEMQDAGGSTLDLSQAHIQTASAQSYRKQNRTAAFDALSSKAARFHGWNDAFSFALAGTGRAHAVVGFAFSLWDVAPFAIFFEEAGGTLTDWKSGDITQRAKTAVGAATRTHAELVKTLRGFD